MITSISPQLCVSTTLFDTSAKYNRIVNDKIISKLMKLIQEAILNLLLKYVPHNTYLVLSLPHIQAQYNLKWCKRGAEKNLERRERGAAKWSLASQLIPWTAVQWFPN